MKFCLNCEKMLVKKSNSNTYKNYCTRCMEYFPLSSPILYRKVNTKAISNIKQKASNIVDDETYITIERKCKNKICKNTNIKFFIDYSSMKRVYVCSECGYHWSEN